MDAETQPKGKKENMPRCEGQTSLGAVARGGRGGRSGHWPKDKRESKVPYLKQREGPQRWTWKTDDGPLVERQKKRKTCMCTKK